MVAGQAEAVVTKILGQSVFQHTQEHSSPHGFATDAAIQVIIFNEKLLSKVQQLHYIVHEV